MPRQRNTKLIFASAMCQGLDTETAHHKKDFDGEG